MTDRSELFISTEELADRLGEANLKVVDGSWYLPTVPRDAIVEYEIRRIPGAVHLDIDVVADTSTPLPHMLPDAASFAKMAGDLGLRETDEIVVYDGAGLASAPRVWWMLRLYGAKKVRILEGGFERWMREGRPLDRDDPKPPVPAVFRATFDPRPVCGMDTVARHLAEATATVIDTRPAERFTGAAPEPREGIPSGHMPGATGIPASSFVTGLTLASDEAIRAALAGVDLDRPIVCSCGSGVTAAILWLALVAIGVEEERLTLYDGSWSEWATRGGEIVTGA
ncbi:MAG: sulfurtransferase [Siculibacillus sp.]|nr:sulfurtransferase [Siculibacillus sp.]